MKYDEIRFLPLPQGWRFQPDPDGVPEVVFEDEWGELRLFEAHACKYSPDFQVFLKPPRKVSPKIPFGVVLALHDALRQSYNRSRLSDG